MPRRDRTFLVERWLGTIAMATKIRETVSDPGKLLTASEVAEVLSVSTRQVWRLRSAGILTTIRLGPQTVRFSERQVRRIVLEGIRQ